MQEKTVKKKKIKLWNMGVIVSGGVECLTGFTSALLSFYFVYVIYFSCKY